MAKEKRKNEDFPSSNPISWIFSGIAYLFKGVFRGSWWIVRKSGKAAWWAIRGASRGAWKAIRGTGHGVIWVIKQPYRILRYIISGRVPEFENARQEEIFWRIKRYYRRKRLFLVHSMMFAISLVIGLGIGIYSFWSLYTQMTGRPDIDYWQAEYSRNAYSWTLIFGVWLLVLGFHFFFNRMGNEEDHALGEAFEREYTRSDNQAAYREQYERLVEPSYDDEIDYEEKPKHNHGVH